MNTTRIQRPPWLWGISGHFTHGVFVMNEERKRTKEAYQDGADFFAVKSTHAFGTARLLARYEYPFTSRQAVIEAAMVSVEGSKDWDDAAQEAAAMFLRDNPEYKLVDSSELADKTER